MNFHTHPLLIQLDKRAQSDISPYLLCILESGEVCRKGACSLGGIILEQSNGTVRGTILIPCIAMRKGFPFNGMYFQVHEVFVDDESSENLIHVPRELIWNLRRRTTYFGT